MSDFSKKIRSLSLKQFTAFEEAAFEFSPGINVLIGANSTGKTHILKIIYNLIKACKKIHQFKTTKEGEQTWEIGFHDPIFQADKKPLIRQSNDLSDEKTTDICLKYADAKFYIKIYSKTLHNDQHLENPYEFYESPSAVFLPAQEFLSINEGFISAYTHRELPYDEIYYDLALALNALPLREDKLGDVQDSIELLKKAIIGDDRKNNDEIVTQQNGRFYFHLPDAAELDVRFVAEGYRKLATLYYLLRNGSLTKDSILLWDEPEANLNPKLITEVVRVLQKFAESGMQIFIATHDYLLSHELSLLSEYHSDTNIDIRFFALYKPDRKAGVQVESAQTLAEIKNNPILEEFAAHYDRESELFYTSGGQEK